MTFISPFRLSRLKQFFYSKSKFLYFFIWLSTYIFFFLEFDYFRKMLVALYSLGYNSGLQ